MLALRGRPSIQGRRSAREYPVYLVCIPVRMFMQEALQYWALIINIAQGSLPNIPRILFHVPAMYCKVVYGMK